MSDTSDLIVNEAKTEVAWNYFGEKIQVSANNIGQAIRDDVNGKVVISLCKDEYPYKIKAFDLAGTELFAFDEPTPFEFYFLKKHSAYGVSIVCSTNEPIDGRMDWQFEINYKNGELKRVAPSY